MMGCMCACVYSLSSGLHCLMVALHQIEQTEVGVEVEVVLEIRERYLISVQYEGL